MKEQKNTNKKQNSASNENIVPGNIKGKIDVDDTRERKDGPGGN